MIASTALCSDVLHRAQAEANRIALLVANRRERVLAGIDIGRQHANIHFAAFVDVLHDLRHVAGFRREQRGHEIDRIVRLQISRYECQKRISRRVRLVEAVSGELLHQVEDLLGLLRRMTPLRRALHEAAALLGHLFRFLLAHGAAQHVGLAQRVAGDAIRDLHHLLLVDHDAVGLLQDFLQLREDRRPLPCARACAR